MARPNQTREEGDASLVAGRLRKQIDARTARSADESVGGQWVFGQLVEFLAQFVYAYGASSGKLLQSDANGLASWTDTLTRSFTFSAAQLFAVATGGGFATVFNLKDTTGGFTAALQIASWGQDWTLQLPDPGPGSFQVVYDTYAQTLANKTLDKSNFAKTTGSADGFHIRDNATSTKRLYFALNNGSGDNLFDVRGSAQSYVFKSTGSCIVPLSPDNGSITLTGQTGSVAAANLAAPSFASVWVVAVYVKTTTAGNAGDVVSVTIGWTDGTAQTKVVIAAHDLATLNAYSEGSVRVYIASPSAPTYATTVTKTGTPQYELRVRQTLLG